MSFAAPGVWLTLSRCSRARSLGKLSGSCSGLECCRRAAVAGAAPVSDQWVAAPSCLVAACSSGALGKLIALARRVQAYDAR